MNKSNKKKPGSWKRPTLITLCVILSIILVLAITVVIYGESLLNKINYIDNEHTLSQEEAENIQMNDPDLETVDPDSTGPVVRPEDVIIPEGPVDPLLKHENLLNIMLVGQDRREGQGRQRSDTMILMTFNKSQGTITLTSFMRDQYVNIPGYGKTKLCHAYQYGGMGLLEQTIYNHYGVDLDGMVEVDFSGFEDIVDLLGGVDIELTKKEAKKLNADGGWNLSSGMQHLNGEQALLYARLRSIDTDYRRAERQRKVLTSIIEEYKSQSLPKMLSLLEEMLPMVSTNVEKSDITKYLTEMFPMFSSAEINNLRIPVDGTFDEGHIRVYENMNLWCQYNIDFEKNRDYLEEIFAE